MKPSGLFVEQRVQLLVCRVDAVRMLVDSSFDLHAAVVDSA